MKKGSNLRALALGGCSVIGLILSLAGMAQAQTATPPAKASDDSDTTTVVVTGIRGSLSASAREKRNSDIILDSITSEDLGKFPDANVAESLQRIPGVSIDRSLGEGASVTVRGFGPQFNNVLVNSRPIANDTNSRAFSFNDIPAELISGADVYKSSQASVSEGGIGATINLKTPRPLDIGKAEGIFTLRDHYETLSRKNSPDAFALYSNVFDGGKMGFMVSFSEQQRDAREDSFSVSGYVPNDTIGTQAAQTNGYGANTNPDTPLYTDVRFPRNYNLNQSLEQTERTGVSATFQYRPQDNLTFTVDTMYTRYNINQRVNTGAFFFLENEVRTASIDANRDVVAQTENGNWDMIEQNDPRRSMESMIGFNADWKPTDRLHLVGDLSLSGAHNLGGSGSYYVVIGIPTNASWTQPESGGLPTLQIQGAPITDSSNARAHYTSAGGDNTINEVNQAKFDATYDVSKGIFETLRGGVSVVQDQKSEQEYGIGSGYCTYCGYTITIPQSMLSPISTGNNFLGGDLAGIAPQQWFQYNGQAYLNYLGSAAAANALDALNGAPAGTTAAALAADGGFSVQPLPSSYKIKELDEAAYVEADFRGTVAGLPWFLNVGGRYIATQVTAIGQNPVLQDIIWVSEGNQTPVYASGAPKVQTFKSSYTDFLPSANFKLNLTNKLLLRLAASKTLTRPDTSDMAPNTVINDTRPGNMLASGGNPALLPYLSTNYDASLEWYPKKNVSFSAAIFRKDVKDFIDYGVAPEAFAILNSQQLQNTSTINGNIHLADPNFTATTASFLTTRPRNLASTWADGLELAGTYNFDYLPGWWSGFGLNANATLVDSDAKVTNASEVTGRAFALPGLGNSYNLVVFYEKGPISIRLAYNDRAKFLASLTGDGSGGPVFTQDYKQIDMRASYQLTKRINVFIEGTNIGQAHLINKDLYGNELIGDYLDGAFYNVGFRMDF